MRAALEELAALAENDAIAARDPLCPLSFSLVPPNVEKLQTDALRLYAKNERLAFSPLGPDGRPIRKHVLSPTSSFRWL